MPPNKSVFVFDVAAAVAVAVAIAIADVAAAIAVAVAIAIAVAVAVAVAIAHRSYSYKCIAESVAFYSAIASCNFAHTTTAITILNTKFTTCLNGFGLIFM